MLLIKVIRETNHKLLEAIHRDVQLTREDVKTLIENLATRAAGPIENPASPTSINPAPRREDYEHLLNWWDHAPWQAVKNGTNPQDLTVKGPIISLFMEDEFSKPIWDGVKAALRKDLYGYWNELFWVAPGEL